MLELDLASLHLLVGVSGVQVGDVDLLVHDRLDALARGHGAGGLHEEHGHHHEGGQNLGDVGHEGGEVTHQHTAVGGEHHVASEPQNRDDGGVHEEGHEGGHPDHDHHGAAARPLEVGVGPREALVLVLLADEGLDHADVGHVLLHVGVEAVHLLLHRVEAGEAHAEEEEDDQQDGGDRHGQHQGQLTVQGDGHNEGADEHTGGTESHAEQGVDEVLELGDVVGEAGHQGACVELVDVGEGELLYLAVDVGAEVGGEVHRGLSAEVGTAHTADHHEHRGEEHSHGQGDDEGGVGIVKALAQGIVHPGQPGGGVLHVVVDAEVDDVGQQAGQNHLADDLHDHEQRPDDEPGQIGLYVLEPPQTLCPGGVGLGLGI